VFWEADSLKVIAEVLREIYALLMVPSLDITFRTMGFSGRRI
jgi:hypothetical protein